MTLTTLTPQQAADKASVSRGTIMNAINDKTLVALRDNRNRWQISADNLSKWMADRTDNISDIISDNADKPDSEAAHQFDEKAMRIAVLETEVKAKDQRISDLEQERDARLADKDQQIADIRKGFDDQIAQIKGERDRWVDHVQRVERGRRRKWWPFG
ncbi:helix-turn-helix domain-containing protein [Loktanella sp. DJP18]|uniref:helix-turn-helix domain-containing protein n=1 Tax=Loktanella sp. DJP18 TaxID=3409788 RepID=UPI003BB59C58